MPDASCAAVPPAESSTRPDVTGHGVSRRPDKCALGEGKSFASFGEIVQGRRRDGEDFLVTLPVDLWSRCRLRCEPVAGASRVEAALPKARRAAEQLLHHVGLATGVRLRVALTRNMPLGKGLSSSTADMLAVVRACESLFGIRLSDALVSRLFVAIEPHDALHYPNCVAYNHRRGHLLAHLDHIPDFLIVAVDAGGEVCTEAYNRSLSFSPALRAEYDALYGQVVAAFRSRDDAAIARCARRSTELQVARTGNPLLARLLALSAGLPVLGVIATHSGTCGGLLLPGGVDTAVAARVQARVARLGSTFRTRTLGALP